MSETVPELTDELVVSSLRESLMGSLFNAVNGLQHAALMATILDRVDPNSPVKYGIVQQVFQDYAKRITDDCRKFAENCEKHPVKQDSTATNLKLLTSGEEIDDDLENSGGSPVPVE